MHNAIETTRTTPIRAWQAAMELSNRQRGAMLAARRRLLGDMGALMRQRGRIVALLAAAAGSARAALSIDALSCDGSAQVGSILRCT